MHVERPASDWSIAGGAPPTQSPPGHAIAKQDFKLSQKTGGQFDGFFHVIDGLRSYR
jgi:hypothetical protein